MEQNKRTMNCCNNIKRRNVLPLWAASVTGCPLLSTFPI